MSAFWHRLGIISLATAWVVLASSIFGQVPTEAIRAKHQRFVEAYAAGDAETALRLGEELAGELPDPTLLAYDLAILRATRGESVAALGWLQRAAEGGFARLVLLDAEAAFAELRELPPFARIRQRIEANRQAELEAFEQRVRENPPRLVAPKRLDPGTPVPLIVALHGRGALAEPIEEIWRPVARKLGAVLATPQALVPYSQGFQWGTRAETAYQTLQAIEAAAERFLVDRDCVILAGFSQGGRRSIATAFAHPDDFAGVVVIGSAMGSESSFPTTPAADLPRFFFGVGALDGVVEYTRATHDAFAEHGIATELAVYPGVGHSFPRDHQRQLRRALKSVAPCAFRKD